MALQLYYLCDLNQQQGFKTETASGRKTGLAGRWGWNKLEPAAGNYDFALIDKVQLEAERANVPWSLSCKAGADTPHWLYSDFKAQRFSFIWDKPYNYPVGSTQCLPVPWDLIYLGKWAKFIQMLGDRYDSDPLLHHVVATGINSITQENSLPHKPEDNNNWLNVLASLGYEQAAFNGLISAMQVKHLLTSCWSASFPTKMLATMFTFGGFPFYKHGVNHDLGLTLLENVAREWPYRGVLMSNAARADGLAPEITTYSGKVPIAFQEVGAQGQRVNELITLCEQASARYLEVYAADFQYC